MSDGHCLHMTVAHDAHVWHTGPGVSPRYQERHCPGSLPQKVDGASVSRATHSDQTHNLVGVRKGAGGGDAVSGININQARATLAKTNWDKRKDVATAHRHRVYTHDCLPLSFFYVNHSKDLIVMGPDSYQTLAIDRTAIDGIIHRLADGGDGILHIDLAAGEFAEVLRERAREVGVASIQPRDIIEDMLDRAATLMLKAQSLRKHATVEEMQQFSQELVKLNEEVASAVVRVRKLEVMVALTADTVLAA